MSIFFSLLQELNTIIPADITSREKFDQYEYDKILSASLISAFFVQSVWRKWCVHKVHFILRQFLSDFLNAEVWQ